MCVSKHNPEEIFKGVQSVKKPINNFREANEFRGGVKQAEGEDIIL